MEQHKTKCHLQGCTLEGWHTHGPSAFTAAGQTRQTDVVQIRPKWKIRLFGRFYVFGYARCRDGWETYSSQGDRRVQFFALEEVFYRKARPGDGIRLFHLTLGSHAFCLGIAGCRP